MTARWQKTSEAVKTISAEKVSIQNRYIYHKVVSTIKIFLTQKTFLLLLENILDP